MRRACSSRCNLVEADAALRGLADRRAPVRQTAQIALIVSRTRCRASTFLRPRSKTTFLMRFATRKQQRREFAKSIRIGASNRAFFRRIMQRRSSARSLIARNAPTYRYAFLTGGEPGIPKGMPNYEEFRVYGSALRQGLRDAGFGDVDIVLRGSAVTGRNYNTGRAFDFRRRSDYDIAIISPSAIARARELGIALRGGGLRTAPLKPNEDLELLNLQTLYDKLKQIYGRETNFMFYATTGAVTARGPYMIVP